MRSPSCLGTIALALGLVSLPLGTGCRTTGYSGTTDLTEPGWQVQRGLAIWRLEAAAPEIAGELLVATHSDGRTVVEFTKTPLPLLVAEVSPRGWRVQLVTDDRRFIITIDRFLITAKVVESHPFCEPGLCKIRVDRKHTIVTSDCRIVFSIPGSEDHPLMSHSRASGCGVEISSGFTAMAIADPPLPGP